MPIGTVGAARHNLMQEDYLPLCFAYSYVVVTYPRHRSASWVSSW